MRLSLANTNGPSQHLSWAEMACKDGTPYPQKFIDDGRVFKLAGIFEKIRFLLGERPIVVLSAYRSLSHNRKIGGAPNSQHLEGRALDLRPPKKMSLAKFHDFLHENARRFGITGIGKYKTFVHIDIRPSDRLVAWSGNGVKDSATN